MICDKCGYNISRGTKCPNCYHDNSDTDYTPDEIVSLIGSDFVAVDVDPKKKTKPRFTLFKRKDIPLRYISSDLFAYASASRNLSVIMIVALGIFGFLLYKTSGSDTLPFTIGIGIFFMLDALLSGMILLGKDWALLLYVPFVILSFPFKALYFLGTRSGYDRVKATIYYRFFIPDLKIYLTHLREKKVS